MGLFTPLDLPGAARIGARYGLSITGLCGLPEGGMNTNVVCSLSGGGRVFLRVYEHLDMDAAAMEHRLIEHLARGGVPVARPLLRASGDEPRSLTTHAGKPAAVFPWVDGETLCRRRATEADVEKAGEALAKVHLAGADFREIGAGRFRPEDLLSRLAGLRGDESLGEGAGAAVERLWTALGAHVERAAGLPRAESVLVHGDLFRANVLFRGGEIAAIVDFECACRGAATFDIAVTLLAWCYGDALQQGPARALFRGYQRVRPLSGADLERLHEDAVHAALRFSVTRLTDYHVAHGEAGAYRDYRRFLHRLSAIVDMGPAGLRAFLGL
ncbi:MAG: homoserine kinase [Polyangiaceae bacterium]